MPPFSPQVSKRPLGESGVEVRLGHELLDDYLRFVAARCRPNSVLAAGYDLKVFFTAVDKDPLQVTMTDVLDFITEQRSPAHGDNVVRLADGEAGLSARTIRRRLATLSGLYGYLGARNLIAASPVPTGLIARKPSDRRGRVRSTPLIRTPRTLPRILDSIDATQLLAAIRTERDRAVLLAMLLGGLRRCEVLGLQVADIDLADRKLTITEGKGGHHRVVPAAAGFFTALTTYLNIERPTCLTRLREAGMSLEAVQAQAGHRNIESTRIYLHLSDTWLSGQYHLAITALDNPLAAAGDPS